MARSAEYRVGLGTAAVATAPGISGVLAAQGLGPDGRGRLAVGMALATIAGSIGVRGLDTAVLSAGPNRPEDRMGRAIAARRSVGVFFGEGLLAGLFAAMVLHTSNLALVALVALMAASSTGYILVRALNLSGGRTDRLLRGDLTSAGVLLVGAVCVRALNLSFEWYITSAVVGLLVGCRVALGAIRRTKVDGQQLRAVRRGLSGLSRPAWAARTLQVAAFRLDRVVLAGLAGTASTGIYAAVVPFAEMTTILQLQLAQLVTVRIANSDGTTRWQQSREWRLAAGLTLAFVTLVALLSESLLAFVYGSEFADGVWALRILVCASGCAVVWRFAEAELFARQAPRGALIATTAAAVLVVGGTAVLHPLGALGASLASLAGYAIAASIVVGYLRVVRR